MPEKIILCVKLVEINNSWTLFSDKDITVISLQADMKIMDLLQKKKNQQEGNQCVCV